MTTTLMRSSAAWRAASDHALCFQPHLLSPLCGLSRTISCDMCCAVLSLAVLVPFNHRQALAQARKSLLASKQDLACVIASGRKADSSSVAPPDAAAAEGGSNSSSSSGGSRYPATCHRLIVLECQPRRPRALLVGVVGGGNKLLLVISRDILVCDASPVSSCVCRGYHISST